MSDPDPLRRLRRFAAAMTGTTATGDARIETALTNLPQDCDRLAPSPERLYGWVYQAICEDAGAEPPVLPTASNARRDRVKAALREMPSQQRAALLLHALEGFSHQATARILGVTEADVCALIDAARCAITRRCHAKVLIIEDDLLTARQVGRIAARMGCSVVGFARRDADALAIADTTHPHLVIADVNLRLGGSGAWAAERIVERHGANVVFVTAYPDLIRDTRLQAFTLINKPIHVPNLQTAILAAMAA
ncbi:MAG: response regulator [Rhodospirillaceae bacterium]|nr:response regulator [Rhodospirillaceae bacterium]